jgi:hypothetical protein
MSNKERAQAKIRTWRGNVAQFAHDNFKFEPDAWQLDAMKAASGSQERLRLCLKACTGPGKTAILAILGWHRLSCFAARGEHPKGAALSITRDNLKDNLWPEMAKWQNRSEFLKSAFTYTKEQIYATDHPSTWFLSARSFAKDADAEAIGRALSGLHSQFPFLLLDEMGDMPQAVGRSAEQIFTGGAECAAIMGAGNPTSTTGLLYHVCNALRSQWEVITITADPDDPKRTPRVPMDHALEQIRLYGRDNPWVMATILGLFPTAGFNSLLGITDVEEAQKRHYRIDQYDFAPKILGVDVAREGDDASVLFPRQGLVAFKPKMFRNVRSNILAGHVAQAEDKWGADGIIVDGTGGYGSGVIDSLQTMGRMAFDCQFAGKAFSPKYANKRAEIWFEMAEWIKNGGALPAIPEIVAELTTPTYTFQGDKLLIEPKDMIKKRLGRSPDYADALAVTFAFPIAAKPQFPQQKTHGEYDPIARERQAIQQNQRGDFDPFRGGIL